VGSDGGFVVPAALIPTSNARTGIEMPILFGQ
jgi:hypothetical protein